MDRELEVRMELVFADNAAARQAAPLIEERLSSKMRLI